MCNTRELTTPDLIPNLQHLRAQLPIDGSTQDAHEFIEELATAVFAEDIDIKIDALVDRWLEEPDEHRR